MVFSPEYKEKLFLEWFNRGQPGYINFHHIAFPDEITGKKPTLSTLQGWIRDDWREKAVVLNEQVKQQLEEVIVREKVEMLRRHAEIGQEISDKALIFLRENEFTTSANALRALIEGIRIERESRGLPDALDKMTKMTDEKLVDQVKGILEKGQIEIEPND